MLSRDSQKTRHLLFTLVVLLSGFASYAYASATLLLEEPYGKMGFFTATGHAAVYLSGVCADSPVLLRPCAPGESGVVLSRYDGVAGYDWIAIPLMPYLYAVERPEDVPLFADAKLVAFLRDRYRRNYLEALAADLQNGETPGGNWYELVGSSYDRAIYGFEIETTPAQDAALIQKYNSSPNRSHFHLVSNNCADFAKDVINFYYPHSLHRSVVADVGMTTPKQMAKRLIKFSTRHPGLSFSTVVFPQVPGTMPRSTAVHGVVESFLKSKKYIVPSAIASPIFAGCVAAVYVGTGAGHFNPARNADVFSADHEPELPLGREDRRAYQRALQRLLAETHPEASARHVEKAWARMQSRARTELDDRGGPILQMQVGQQQVSVGASAGNVLSSDAPPQLVQQLLEARLQTELRRKSQPHISESEVARDWRLLQEAITVSENDAPLTARSSSYSALDQLGEKKAGGSESSPRRGQGNRTRSTF
ncbi:MAG: hypothetical protein ABSA80_16325 [Terriglobales bacterium]|jgi:hypothetical protein